MKLQCAATQNTVAEPMRNLLKNLPDTHRTADEGARYRNPASLPRRPVDSHSLHFALWCIQAHLFQISNGILEHASARGP